MLKKFENEPKITISDSHLSLQILNVCIINFPLKGHEKLWK